MNAGNPSVTPPIRNLQDRFLAILPRITRHGEIYFRHLSPERREEAVAEMVALSWKWFRRLVERGKEPEEFPSSIATLAARAVKSGRRLRGQERAKDVLSPLAQRLHGFATTNFSSLIPPRHTTAPWEEALTDNTTSPVPDQVVFRIDFATWLCVLGGRTGEIARDMAVGHTTSELAEQFGVSQARVSQLRREFARHWGKFTATPEPEDQPAAVPTAA